MSGTSDEPCERDGSEAFLMIAHLDAAVTFAAAYPALDVAHRVMDHWGQAGSWAANKGRHGTRHENHAGRRACLAHVVTYTAGTAALVALVWAVFGLAVTPVGFLAGQFASAVTHYWADRRFTLAWLAKALGKADFYALGAPRPGHGDAPHLGTGAYVLDQSWHYAWLLVAALLTALA